MGEWMKKAKVGGYGNNELQVYTNRRRRSLLKLETLLKKL